MATTWQTGQTGNGAYCEPGGGLPRHAVNPGPAQAERDIEHLRAAGQRGLDVPNGVYVGTDRPFPLMLCWPHALPPGTDKPRPRTGPILRRAGAGAFR